MRLHFAVFAIANRADRFCGAGRFAAGAIVGFRVASVALAGTGVRTVAVRSPCTPVVAEDVAGCEGSFIGCVLGAQTAGGAGFVIDCLFRAGRGRFQVLVFCRFSSEVMRLHFAVFAIANRADCFRRAGRFAAVAVVRFRVAFVALAGTGVRTVAIRSPCLPVVAEDVAGCEGSFIGCALGAQTAGSAGLVIDRFFRAGRGGLQILFICCLSGEVMCIHFSVCTATNFADSFCSAGRCAAGTIAGFRVACISGADTGVCAVAVGLPRAVVVTEDVAGCEGGFIGCAFGTQTAGGAGLVIDCFLGAGCGGFQVLFFCLFSGEAVRQKVAVFSLAILADCFLRAGCCAAGAIVGFRVACVALAGTGVRTVAVRSPCAPIVAEGGIFCGEGVACADFAAFAGQVINRIVQAVRSCF